MTHQFIVSSRGDEVKLNSSLDATDLDLAKNDDNMMIAEDSDKELAPQFSIQAANVELSGSSLSGDPTLSAIPNPLVRTWVVEPELTKNFSLMEEPMQKCRKRPLRTRNKDQEDHPRHFKAMVVCLFCNNRYIYEINKRNKIKQ